ncbi:hypothetical protein PsalMR5_03573 [Piscirickettsia salmonis]|uniref:hypothetical protein n=1 Tax=Piscirickettsia salmonis TaxID=1238 RepID=UPI0012BB10DD|nr:hypothetical protein [Piscirickettsia salmonis]QGP56095.1 hypothetical protein PsalSR1_03565 [Piscirickettsia salmonis]QGP58033.1 hypothetical protein PsalBI1_00587 [Piscirickettsia salmonis]QGP65667.1 hypothetical protein PsalMR5_03573 [Piscirickettsia salmonis]
MSANNTITSQDKKIELLEQNISGSYQLDKSSFEASGGENPCIFEGRFSNGQSGTAANSSAHLPSTNH